MADEDSNNTDDSTSGSTDDGDSAISWAIIGILLMLDICLITNYYVVRALRRWTDALTETTPPKSTKSASGGGGPISNCLEIFVFGYILGMVKAMPLSVEKFPKWQPIPHKLGLIFTSIVVLLSLALLSPQYFEDYIGINLDSVTLSTDFCSDSDSDVGLEEFKEYVGNITNYQQATLQYEHMTRFYEALINDTSLYGEEGYTCPTEDSSPAAYNPSGRKEDWEDLTIEPASLYGNFFPGFCTSAQQSAIDQAASTTCEDEQCACPVIPSTSATRWFGVDGKKLCFLRLCMSMPTVCPAQTDDAEVNLQNYREQQLALAADVDSVDDVDDEVYDTIEDTLSDTLTTILYQVDVASNIYSIYTCVALFFPTPLVVFRLPYSLWIKKIMFGAQQKWFIISFILLWWALAYVSDLLLTDDFTIFLENLKAGDPCFLDGDYLAARQTVINDICEDFVGQETLFETYSASVNQVLYEVGYFASDDTCKCYFPMQSMYELRSDNYPLEDVEDLGFSETIDDFCYYRVVMNDENDCTVYTPADDIEYLGNRTICTDSDYARELALQSSSTLSGNTDWYTIVDLWISSGLIASFLVKIAMSNFAIWLLRLADPFMVCNGEFLWIPAKLGDGLGGRSKNDVFAGFKKNKEGTLRNLALRGCIIWCILMHLCLFNLLYAAYDSYDAEDGESIDISFSTTDTVIMASSLGISLVVVLLGLWFIRRLRNGFGTYHTDSDSDSEYESDYSEGD